MTSDFYSRRGKRVLDLGLAVPGLVALAPVLLGTTIVVRTFLGSPVLFVQSRPGFRGKPFLLYKFRTMTDETDSNGRLLPDSRRLTRLGRFLRSTSIDELPELWNVIRGDMSLVGPRPLLMRYLPLYTPQQFRRHEVKPGITGWAQVSGRNMLSWDEKFKLDVFYVDNLSLWLDLRILFKTVWSTIRRDGIEFQNGWTMSYFTGSRDESI